MIGGRFLWVRDLSRSDIALAAVATLFTVAATASGPSGPMANRAIILIMSGVATAVALSKLAEGVGWTGACPASSARCKDSSCGGKPRRPPEQPTTNVRTSNVSEGPMIGGHATFSAPGSYELELTARDGELSNAARVVIIVK